MLRKMAWRNLWRNRRRTLITLTAMVFGLFTCLVVFTIGDGTHTQMVRLATSTYTGHIQVGRQGFHAEQKMELWLKDDSLPVMLLRQAEESRRSGSARKGSAETSVTSAGSGSSPAATYALTRGNKAEAWQKRVVSWSPRLFGAGLVSTGQETSGGFFLGLDLVRESRVTRLSESILKAMTQEAIDSGRYKERLPASYWQDLQASRSLWVRVHSSRPMSPVEQSRLIHRAIQKLQKNPRVYEQTIQGLLRGKEVAIGKGLARALHARVGSYLAVVAQPYQGLVSDDRYQIVALMESGSADMDMSLCILPLEQLQELLWLQHRYHTLVLHLNTENGQHIRRIAQQMAQRIQAADSSAPRTGGASVPRTSGTTTQHAAGASTPHTAGVSAQHAVNRTTWEVLPWQKVSPELYEFINADEASQYLITLIVFFLVAFIILNTLQMALLERTREFGVLRSLGMKGRQLIALVLWEGVFLAVVAIGVGICLALPVMIYLHYVGIPLSEPLHMGGILLELQLEGQITTQGLLFPALVVLCTTCLVSLYPAYRATVLKPVEALRHV